MVEYYISYLQRSVLAYHHDSSIDGGLNHTNVGVSTTSTTSRSTSKSSGGIYRPDGYLNHSSSTSNNMPPIGEYVPGHMPYGYEATMFHANAAAGMYKIYQNFSGVYFCMTFHIVIVHNKSMYT